MKRKYDLFNKSDMERFPSDLLSEIVEKSEEALMDQEYEVTCPECSSVVSIKPGEHPCPNCGKNISLTLDINFE